MKKNKITLILIILFSLNACESVKNAVQGKKRSKSADEFLVEKKNPLTMPPDFNKLPTPGQTEDEEIYPTKDSTDVKNLLNLSEQNQIDKNNKTNNKSTEIESTVLQKIQ